MTVVHGGMPRPASSNDTQIAIRLPNDWLERADALVPFVSRPGIAITRSDVLRAALAKGLDALEKERPGPATAVELLGIIASAGEAGILFDDLAARLSERGDDGAGLRGMLKQLSEIKCISGRAGGPYRATQAGEMEAMFPRYRPIKR